MKPDFSSSAGVEFSSQLGFDKTSNVSNVESGAKSNTKNQRLIVCLGRSCRKYSSEEVFANFKENLPANTELISVGCLGQCGNGSMVLVESAQTNRANQAKQTWYSQVHPQEVSRVIEEHLIGQSQVKAMLYPKFHAPNK